MQQTLKVERNSSILQDTAKQDSLCSNVSLYLLDLQITLISYPRVIMKQCFYPFLNNNEGSYLKEIGILKKVRLFTEFDRDIHVVEPFHIPSNWVKFRACDYGYGSHSAVLWFAVAPNEQIIVYRELYVSKILATDLADMILELEAEDGNIKYGVLDSSFWHKRGHGDIH